MTSKQGWLVGWWPAADTAATGNANPSRQQLLISQSVTATPSDITVIQSNNQSIHGRLYVPQTAQKSAGNLSVTNERITDM